MSAPRTVDWVVKGGIVYTVSGPIRASLAIDEGKVVAIGSETVMPHADRVIDAEERIVIPGLMDTHCHFRDPGYTHKEDFETGTKAAAAGGVTLAVDMPNVNPPPNTLERFRAHRENAKRKAVVDFSHNAAGTIAREIPGIAQEGPMGFKIFMMTDIGREYPHMPGIGVDDQGALLELFTEIAKVGAVCLVHPWNQEIWTKLSDEAIRSGKTDFREYARAVRAFDSIIFDSAVSALLLLQGATGVKLHILHMSSAKGFDMVRRAKEEGRKVTTEVNPHDIFLANSWSKIEKLGPYALGWQVPEKEGEATWRALSDGAADVIATDHAPHTKEEKEEGWKNMWKAPGGTPSIEWYLSLVLTEVNRGRISLERVVKLCSENPAKIFGVFPRKGWIGVGADADLVIVNMRAKKVIKSDKMYTKCGWTPYEGEEVQGLPVLTMVRGVIVMEDGEVHGKPGFGEYISPLTGQR